MQGLFQTSLKFVSNEPYIEATVQGDCDCPPSQNLVQLDLGAPGGAGRSCLVFNKDRALTAGIVSKDGSNVESEEKVIYGVGGQSLPYKEARIKYVDIGGYRVERPHMTAGLVDADMDLSNFGNGVLCVSLFEDSRIVI